MTTRRVCAPLSLLVLFAATGCGTAGPATTPPAPPSPGSSAASPAQPDPDDATIDLAKTVAVAFVQGRAGEVAERFTAEMRAAMPEAKLRAIATELQEEHGAFESLFGEARLERRGDLTAAVVPCRFERGDIVVRIVLDPERRVTGLFLGSAAEAMVGPATELVDLLSQGRFAEAHAGFDPALKRSLPVEDLEAAWKKVQQDAGAFAERVKTEAFRRHEHAIVRVICRFDHKPLAVQLAYDREGRVTGLFFMPHAEYEPPAYADPASFTEVDVSVGSGELALPGTLTLPKGEGPFPGVVLVHGSGPGDRDESVGPNKPFRDLAWGLATRGVAVLRYDKRTRVHKVDIERLTPKEETVDDAVQAADLLLGRRDVSAVFVVGHSMGGEMIPRIAPAAPKAAGFVLLAGNTRPLEDLIEEQNRYLRAADGSLSEEDKEALRAIEQDAERIRAFRRSGVLPEGPPPLGLRETYLAYLAKYDPAREARRVERPMLILQGERDYQVTMEDFQGWKRALQGKPNVTFKSYPRLNHLLFGGDGPSTPDEYAAGGNVDLEVVEDIARFVKTNAL